MPNNYNIIENNDQINNNNERVNNLNSENLIIKNTQVNITNNNKKKYINTKTTNKKVTKIEAKQLGSNIKYNGDKKNHRSSKRSSEIITESKGAKERNNKS